MLPETMNQLSTKDASEVIDGNLVRSTIYFNDILSLVVFTTGFKVDWRKTLDLRLMLG